MREIMQAVVDLDARTAHAIAGQLRELAQVDGTHPREEALIAAFEADLPATEGTDLSDVRSPEAREALLRSLVLLALADGRISTDEGAHIRAVAAKMGKSEADVARAVVEVGRAMLSQFEGVTIFREQVLELGLSMGLSAADVEAALG